MTPQQRSEAARRAAATRRARRFGQPPPYGSTPPPRRRQAFATPKVNARTLTFEALAKLEDALVARATERGITPDMATAFERFQKIKARALQPGTPAEGDTALRMGLIELVKLVL